MSLGLSRIRVADRRPNLSNARATAEDAGGRSGEHLSAVTQEKDGVVISLSQVGGDRCHCRLAVRNRLIFSWKG